MIQQITDYITGDAYSLVSIFGTGIQSYPANTGDLWQARLIETKYKRYTSIEVYDYGLSQYVYICRAIGDRSIINFKHYLWLAENNFEDD